MTRFHEIWRRKFEAPRVGVRHWASLFLRENSARVIEPRRTKQPWNFRHRGARPLNTWRNRTNRIRRRDTEECRRAAWVHIHVHAPVRTRAIFMAQATRGWKRMPRILGCSADNRCVHPRVMHACVLPRDTLRFFKKKKKKEKKLSLLLHYPLRSTVLIFYEVCWEIYDPVS